jgi:hypothetical protein
MEKLLSVGVDTWGCCCGHNGSKCENPMIIVNSDYTDVACDAVLSFISTIDSRKWDIMRWETRAAMSKKFRQFTTKIPEPIDGWLCDPACPLLVMFGDCPFQWHKIATEDGGKDGNFPGPGCKWYNAKKVPWFREDD